MRDLGERESSTSVYGTTPCRVGAGGVIIYISELRVPVSSSAERKETMTQIHAEKSRGGRV